MFCDVSLAARIERAECDLVASACANVSRRVPDVLTMAVGGGLAVHTEPDSSLNKVAGLGFAPFDEAEWTAVEAAHARRGAAIQVEVATLGDPAIARFLTGRGYGLAGVENVLARALAPDTPVPVHADITIEPSGADEIETWLDVTATSFGALDAQGVASHESFDRAAMERVVRDFAVAQDFVRYLARRGGEVAGSASMRMAGGIAQLCGAATLPQHRRRGVQRLLLEHRLAAAARAGCTLAVVTTLPGSKSQQNVMRLGFALLYSRNVLRREPA